MKHLLGSFYFYIGEDIPIMASGELWGLIIWRYKPIWWRLFKLEERAWNETQDYYY
jgi:hypothetical protein